MGKSSAMSRKSAPNDRAGALSSRTGHLLIAVSFRRLFLGGLLPSRARFRFAGQMPSTAAFRAAARPVRGSKSVSHVPEHLSAMYPVRTLVRSMTGERKWKDSDLDAAPARER